MFKPILLFLVLWICLAPAMAQDEAQETKQESDSSSESSTTENNGTKTKVKISLPTDRFQQSQTDAKHYLVHDEIEEVLVGTDSYLAIVDPNTSVNVKGNFIVLPDWAKGIKNPKTAGFTKYMSTIGWRSLTVQVPRSPENYPSIHHEQAQRLEENQKSLADYQLLLTQLLQSAIEKSQQHPGPIIIIAEGQVAANVANILSQQNDDIEALIILSGYVLTNHQDSTINRSVANAELPILDIFLSKDNLMIANQAKQRQEAVNVELKSFYRQHRITNIQPGYYPKESLIRAVVGWLKTIGF